MFLPPGEGWEHRSDDSVLDGADAVYAYAVVYDAKGRAVFTTGRSSLTIGPYSQFSCLACFVSSYMKLYMSLYMYTCM